MKLQIDLDDEQFLLFKQCIRKLLDTTFLLKDREPKQYQFLSDKVNRQKVSEYLSAMGFDVAMHKEDGFFMLCANGNDAETVRLKTANLIPFSKHQRHLFILLWNEYQKGFGYRENGDVIITKGDLIDIMKSYGVKMSPRQICDSMTMFRKYSLVNFPGEWNHTGEGLPIQLYPTLCYALDNSMFLQTAETFLEGISDNYEDEEDESEEGNEELEEDD